MTIEKDQPGIKKAKKPEKKKKPNARWKSAVTGYFVTAAYALANKATTYLRVLSPRKKKNSEEIKG